MSGHLFNAYVEEAAKFARTRLVDLKPAREPKLMAGIISGVRTQMTQRGRMLIVTLDDNTAQVEVTVYSEIYEANRSLFREDEFLAVQGKVAEDRFSGGLRITADRVMDIAAARANFVKALRLSMNGQADAVKLRELIAPFQQNEASCPIVVQYQKMVRTANCACQTIGECAQMMPYVPNYPIGSALITFGLNIDEHVCYFQAYSQPAIPV